LGLDCDAKARQLADTLRAAMGRDDRSDAFWDYFAAKLNGTQGPAHDTLYHIHCHLNDLRDLLERWEEVDLAALLETLEIECC
ncbi:MAG TPA: N(2)-fixation sustaining protein CowN, partial [Lamprocystis sp. (in: g-proteobacteria)]|nr:N(2)-fixation sustaining protein CowN [Lamprocystis sp. (in: g-proteobacteria)]